MKSITFYIFKIIFVFSFIIFTSAKVYSQELESILQQLQSLQEDIKTLEKAVYSEEVKTTSSSDFSNNTDDVLTKHLLKLSELEEQFKIFTNNFEEINFKLDKLSNRITKVQSDNQLRFQDLERSGINKTDVTSSNNLKELPGSSEPQDLGGISDSDMSAVEETQKTQSIYLAKNGKRAAIGPTARIS